MGNNVNGTSRTKDSVEKDYYVVGIGASAGGIQALNTFFENMTYQNNMAFIVVQHLSPNHKSLMVEIISKHTEMKVHQAEEGMTIEPSNVYIIPPDKFLTLNENKIHLSDLSVTNKISFTIDIFFQSLARNYYDRAIAIVLSGSGTDGTRGCKIIKEHGGMVMVQDEISAKFTSMPHNIIISELFDFILPPEKMGDQLIKYVEHPTQIQMIENSNFSQNDLSAIDNEITSVYSIMKKYSGIDFSNYKRNTLLRCIARRMKIHQMINIKDYLKFMYKNPNEVEFLHKGLLISVTKFFRDTEAFKLLEDEIIPQICKNNDASIRIWVAGCATGEEVYSLAILLTEYIKNNKLDIDVKIFATDVNKSALEHASKGIYPESIEEDVSEERLRKFFRREGDYYRVNKKLREMVIFSYHNLINDPPFNKIDLISCRNMFIYMKPVLQRKILRLFHFALNTGGFLFLGNSENILGLDDLFTTCNSKWKIFKSNPVIDKNIIVSNSILNPHDYSNIVLPELPKEYVKRSRKEKQIEEIHSALIEEYVPPCVIIDKDNQVFHLCGDANKYLKVPKGVVTLDILNMVPRELFVILSSAIRKVRKDKVSLSYKDILLSEYKEKIDIVVKPFKICGNQNYIAILFNTIQYLMQDERVEKVNVDKILENRNRDLEVELQKTKDALQTTLEEVETSNEELQSTNEELLASNEELQSTNEELQSVNEELITVNNQYSRKIEELTDLNNDMNNFLSSTNIGTMFLDNDLTIKRFTPAIQEIVNVMDFDIGRPINHISHNLVNIDIVKDAKVVLETLIPITREVQNHNGKWYVLRILPYRTLQNSIKGVTITLVDFTDLKNTTEKLKKLSMAIEQSSNAVIITDITGRIEYVNENFTIKTGYSREEVIGRTPKLFESCTGDNSFYDKLMSVIETGKVWIGELYSTTKTGVSFWEYTTISPVRNEKGDITNYVIIKEDITEQKDMIETIKNNEEKFRLLFNKANDAIFLYGFNPKGVPNKIIEVNDTACMILGYSRKELQEMSHFDLVSEEAIIDVSKIQQSLLDDGSVTYDLDYVSKKGSIIPVEINSHVFVMNDEKVVLSIARDISMRRRNQELQNKLEEEERLHRESLEYDRIKTEFFSNLSHELRTPLNVIFASIQVLEHTIEGELLKIDHNKANKHVIILKQNCYRLMRLVNNLIDITRIDAGYFDVNLQNCNIVNIVEEITLSVAEYIENKSISLTFDTDIEEKIMACDPDQIERILLNLLANSVKFTKPGGKILVELRDKNDYVSLIVKDTGIGIPQDKLGIIFDRFRQVDKSLTRNHEGSGIGLSIVKSLVEMHDGTIDVESEYGKGTSFIINFPVKLIPDDTNELLITAVDEETKHSNIERINIEFSDIYS